MKSRAISVTFAALLAATALGTTAPAWAFKACAVTDTGGVDDKGFNQYTWQGVQDAAKKGGFDAKVLESKAETDYVPNLNSFVTEKCDVIVTVGFLLGDATKAAATANPGIKFSIVDFAYDPTIPNVLGQVYATNQAAFLAGYLAAGVSKTGTVGTFGGINIGPPVTDFMDGFVWGVNYYNKQKGKTVKVLLYNSQVTSPITTRMHDLAVANGIPVVGVAETIPAAYSDYVSWQLAQMNQLEQALAAGG